MTLAAVRTARPTDAFTQGSLKAYGIKQQRQVLRLMRFLALLSDHSQLKQDVLAVRDDLRAFRQLLIERLRSSLADVGCSDGECKCFGERDSSWGKIRNEIAQSPALKELTDDVRSNIYGSLKALHEILPCIDTAGWLDEQLALYHAKSSDPSNAKRAHSDEPSVPNGVRLDPSSQELVRIPFAFRDGKTYQARIVFEGSVVTPRDILKVAEHLLRIAESMSAPDESSGTRGA